MKTKCDGFTVSGFLQGQRYGLGSNPKRWVTKKVISAGYSRVLS